MIGAMAHPAYHQRAHGSSPCFDGPGDMRAACRGLDWGATPLGPSGDWPASLCAAVQLLLAQPSPSLLLWGPELVVIYNDAARDLLGQRQPIALGGALRLTAEPAHAAVYDAVLRGEIVTRRGRPFDALALDEHGPAVNTWSPIADPSGAVAGVLVTARDAVPAPSLGEERLRSALRAARLFAWTFDADEGRVHYSANYDEVIGFAAEGRPALLDDTEVWASPSERARFVEGLRQALNGQGDLHLEYRLEHPRTGESVWIEAHGTPHLRGARGALVTGIGRNVTARKRVERVLRDSEARQAFLLELGDRLATVANPAEVQSLAAEMIGRQLRADFATYCTYDADTGDAVVLRGWARKGRPFPARTYRMHQYPVIMGQLRAGREYVAADLLIEGQLGTREVPTDIPAARGVAAVPLLKLGRLVAFFTVIQMVPRRFEPGDIALLREAAERTWAAVHRARVEAELRASEERLRAVLVAGRMAHWRWDPLSDRMHASDTMAELFGFDDGVRPVLLEGQLLGAVHPDDFAEHQAAVSAAVRDGHGWHREYRVVRPRDGSLVWLEESAHMIREPAAGRMEFVGLVWDVTERKRSEAALRDSEGRARALLTEAREASRVAEAANQAKDEFLATLSHELRTPVAAILLWAGVIRAGAIEAGALGRALDAIVQSAESQSRLIEDLLDLSRLRSGKLSLAPMPIDVGSVLLAALEVVRPAAVAKNLELAVDVPSELGVARFDPARLKQVLWNLLSNAAKFTLPGGFVGVRARRTQAWLEIEVVDDGEGIDPQFMPHLFERFRQADMGETRAHGGLGIGLALSRQLIELQGGRIEAHSEGRGRGACFRVCLPWIDADLDSGHTSPAGARALPSEPLAGVGVLLVEDDTRTRQAMALTLERAGAAVVPVATGEEALARLAPGAPGEASPQPLGADVIVCDLGLPGMSGYELIGRVGDVYRAHGENVPPACALSAYARDVDRARAIETGFDLYVPKPVSPERLIEVVEVLRDIARSAEA
jgi:PAS domain S-box-containing protein